MGSSEHVILQPMFISSRLECGLRVGDTSTLHISAERRDSEGRVIYHWAIEDGNRVVEEGSDLRSGCGADVDYREMMSTFLSFLSHAADVYRSEMSADAEKSSFSAEAQEWAYMNASEIEYAECELSDTDDEGEGN